MDIELLVVPDCPHQAVAADLLQTALIDVGLPAGCQLMTITREAEPDFAGSPTYRVKGADPFPAGGEPTGLNCRIYLSGSTLGGLPDLPALRQAVKPASDRAGTTAR